MSNKAAWLKAEKQRPMVVEDAPMPVPGPHEVIIRNHAVAINPVNWALQAMAIFPVQYPFIGGNDAAGEIVEIGSEVKDFKVGDRVLAACWADGTPEGQANSAFQLYFSAKPQFIAKLPDNTSYAGGSVFPLCMATAASALFQKDKHGLELPKINPDPQGKVVLVWGGGSSVGACAIQMLVGAGYDVATTANGRNLEAMKEIGAKYAFDYTKETVEEDIISALKGQDSAGAFCAVMGPDIIRCGQIVDKLGGKKFVSTILPTNIPTMEGLPEGVESCNGKFKPYI
ncbi:Zeta-crystallin [Arthrobotrys entomopaga]|nr:Zeta-crystallin [Arthrobotrys entomopaga]